MNTCRHFLILLGFLITTQLGIAQLPRIVVMPCQSGSQTIYEKWVSRISDRVKSELFTTYECLVISRSNSMTLQSEKLLSLTKNPKLNQMDPPAADVVIYIYFNGNEKVVRLEIFRLQIDSKPIIIEEKVTEGSDFVEKNPSSLALLIGQKLGLPKREARRPQAIEKNNHTKESISILTPKISEAQPLDLVFETTTIADIAMASSVKNIQLVERTRLKGILEEHFQKAVLGSMPGTERALGLILGADRFVEISLSFNGFHLDGQKYRVDLFAIDPIRGHVQATVKRFWEETEFKDPEKWGGAFNQLLEEARRHAPALITSTAKDDEILRQKELLLLLDTLDNVRLLFHLHGNLLYLEICEVGCALRVKDHSQLVRLNNAMRLTNYPGWGVWPGCRRRAAYNDKKSPQFLKDQNSYLLARNRDVFGPVAEELGRSNDPNNLYSAAYLSNRLGLYSAALKITEKFPDAKSLPQNLKIHQASRKMWALMGLGRYQEAIDIVDALENFNPAEMLMAADAYHLMGAKEEELSILWINRKYLGYGALQYEIDLLRLKAELGDPDSAIDFYRNQAHPRNTTEPEFKFTFLEVLHNAGRKKEAHEFATVALEDIFFKKDKTFQKLAEKVIAENGGEPLPLKSPAEINRPPEGIRFELHPVEWTQGDEHLKRFAKFLSEIWAVEVVVFPSVKIPTIQPLQKPSSLSIEMGPCIGYTRLLRPKLSPGTIARIHIFGKDTGTFSREHSGPWGGGLYLGHIAKRADSYLKGKVAFLSGLSLRHPLVIGYQDIMIRDTGWRRMPYHYPCIFGIGIKEQVAYLPKLSPTSQRVYEKVDHRFLAQRVAEDWQNPYHLEKLQNIRAAFPNLQAENPKPLFTIKPQNTK